MKNLLCGLALLLGLSNCNTELPPPPPTPPLTPPIENTSSYWLSHPSIALVAAEHDMGPDTVIAIVNAFDELYPEKGERAPMRTTTILLLFGLFIPDMALTLTCYAGFSSTKLDNTKPLGRKFPK
jgi:hypothetical protein